MKTTESTKSKRRKTLRQKNNQLEERYSRFFVPSPSLMWRREDDNYSLDQPSPFRWYANETTYGIGTELGQCPA